MDRNAILTIFGAGVTIFTTFLALLEDPIPSWVAFTGIGTGLVLMVAGIIGCFLPDKKAVSEIKAKPIKFGTEKEAVESVDVEPIVLPASQIDEILDKLDAYIAEATNGVPDSEADLQTLENLENDILRIATKSKSALCDSLTEFCKAGEHVRYSFNAQKRNRENDRRYYTFNPSFLSDLRKVKVEIAKMVEAE